MTLTLLAVRPAEVDDMGELTERERIIALEAGLDALRVLLAEQRAGDRESFNKSIQTITAQMGGIATAHDRFAHIVDVEKIDARLANAERLLAEIKESLVPRAEVQARLDGVAGKLETMSTGLIKLDQNLVRLSDEWTNEQSAVTLDEERSYKKRNAFIATISTIVGVVGVSTAVYSASHHTKVQIVQVPAVTTTTVPHP